MTAFPPLNHVAITVRDLSISAPWYGSLFGTEPVIDEDTDPDFHHTVWVLGTGTLFGLHQHATPAPVEAFSEYRVGLDHASFAVESRDDLEKWAARLDELGIAHGDIKDAPYGPDSRSGTPTGSPSSSSPHLRDVADDVRRAAARPSDGRAAALAGWCAVERRGLTGSGRCENGGRAPQRRPDLRGRRLVVDPLPEAVALAVGARRSWSQRSELDTVDRCCLFAGF